MSNLKPISPPPPNFAPRSYPDQATYNKIQRHLSDINDTITEEDIRNVKIDPLPPVYLAKQLDLPKESVQDETEEEYKEGKKINSTWNILDE